MSEQTEYPRPKITVGGPVTEAEIREFMLGTTNQSVGGPTHEQQVGWSNAPAAYPTQDNSVAALDIEAQRALNVATTPAGYGDPQEDLRAQLEQRNREYGQSENEKGALRQTVQQLLDQVKTQQDQFQAMQMQLMAQRSMPQPSQPNFNQSRPVNDPFAGKSDDDILSIKDAKNLVGEAVFPMMQEFQNQTLAVMDQREANAKRMQTRLSPMDEQRVLWQAPWIAGIQSESQRVDAVIAQLRHEQTLAKFTQAAQTQVASTQPHNPQVRQTVRQITHTEAPATTNNEPTQDAVRTGYERDMAQAMLLPEYGGRRLAALRAIASKYGFGIGTGESGGLIAGGQSIY